MDKDFIAAAKSFIARNFPHYVQDTTDTGETAPLRYLNGESEIVVYLTWEKVFRYTDAADKYGTLLNVEAK